MSFTQRTIVVCDDDAAIRHLMVAILATENFAFHQTADAPDAIAAIDESEPALVILDVHVPGGGGAAVLAHIRGRPALAATPVLVVTGKVQALADGWAARMGADAVLLKPFSLDDLRAAVRALVAPDPAAAA